MGKNALFVTQKFESYQKYLEIHIKNESYYNNLLFETEPKYAKNFHINITTKINDQKVTVSILKIFNSS